MSWTEVRCKNTDCSATFKVSNGVPHRDCHVCGTTHSPPWSRYAVDRSGSAASSAAKAARDAVAGEPTVIEVEISGFKANHVERAAEAAGMDASEYVIEAVVSKATKELRLEDPPNRANEHRSVIRDVIEESGQIDPDGLYQEYQRRVDAPRGKRTVRSYVNHLENMGEVRTFGAGPARTYSYVDPDEPAKPERDIRLDESDPDISEPDAEPPQQEPETEADIRSRVAGPGSAGSS